MHATTTDANIRSQSPDGEPGASLEPNHWILELMNARLESARERSKNDIYEIQSELLKTIQNLPTRAFLVTTILGALAIVLAVLSFGGDRWDGGYQAAAQYAFQVEQLRTSTTKQLEVANDKIDAVATRVAALEATIKEALALMASKSAELEQQSTNHHE